MFEKMLLFGKKPEALKQMFKGGFLETGGGGIWRGGLDNFTIYDRDQENYYWQVFLQYLLYRPPGEAKWHQMRLDMREAWVELPIDDCRFLWEQSPNGIDRLHVRRYCTVNQMSTDCYFTFYQRGDENHSPASELLLAEPQPLPDWQERNG